MSHQVAPIWTVEDNFVDEISCMDVVDKVHFLRDFFGAETVFAMTNREMDERISEIKFEELCR